MQVGDRNGGGGRLARLVPATDWLPRYDRRWLRGDVAAGHRRHGAGRAEEPRLRGHRRHPAAERALRRGGGRDHLRAVLHVAADLDRAELVAGGGRGRRGAVRPASRASRPRSWSRRSRSSPACCSCCWPSSGSGWIAQFLSQGGGHRVPGGRRDRRRDRRAAEADRDRGGGRERVARARSWLRLARRRRTAPRSLVGAAALARDPRAALARAPRCRARSCSWSAGCSRRGSSTSSAHGVALVGDVPRGLPAPELPGCDARRRPRSRRSSSRRSRCC